MLNLSNVAIVQYEQTKNQEGLEEAIRHAKKALVTLPRQHEHRAQILNSMASVYGFKFKLTSDIADLHEQLKYSQEMVESIPLSHQVRGARLLDHMKRLKHFVWETQSLTDVDEAIVQGSRLLKDMSDLYSEKLQNKALLGELLLRRYILSDNVSYLVELTNYGSELATQDKELVADVERLKSLRSVVASISKAPANSPVAVQARYFLREVVRSQCQAKSFIHGFVRIHNQHGSRLNVYVDSLNSNRELSERDIERLQAVNPAASKDTGPSDPSSSATAPIVPPKSQTLQAPRSSNASYTRGSSLVNDFDPVFGTRHLAVDPQSKKFIFDNHPMLLGLDEEDMKPVSWVEFQLRQARREWQSFETEEREGKDPDRNLCRSCRSWQILSQDNFYLESRVKWMPFGNFWQLKCRKNCSICKLILHMVTCSERDLHLNLSAIDPEVQGTQLYPGSTRSGEHFLKVNMASDASELSE